MLQTVGLEILSLVVEFNPSMVRDFILSDAQQTPTHNDVRSLCSLVSAHTYKRDDACSVVVQLVIVLIIVSSLSSL